MEDSKDNKPEENKAEGNQAEETRAGSGSGGNNMSLLAGVSVEVSLRIGTCSMTMGEVLDLEPGDVVQMNESIDDPVLLYLNDKVVATGEVVLIEDRLGLKIVEILQS